MHIQKESSIISVQQLVTQAREERLKKIMKRRAWVNNNWLLTGTAVMTIGIALIIAASLAADGSVAADALLVIGYVIMLVGSLLPVVLLFIATRWQENPEIKISANAIFSEATRIARHKVRLATAKTRDALLAAQTNFDFLATRESGSFTWPGLTWGQPQIDPGLHFYETLAIAQKELESTEKAFKHCRSNVVARYQKLLRETASLLELDMERRHIERLIR